MTNKQLGRRLSLHRITETTLSKHPDGVDCNDNRIAWLCPVAITSPGSYLLPEENGSW